MSDRRRHLAPIVPALLAGVVVAGCARAIAAAPGPAAAAADPSIPAAASRAAGTPAPVHVLRPGRPDVSIEPLGGDAYRITVSDTTAKAWRVVVRGIEELAGSSLAVAVETGDVDYGIAIDRGHGATGPSDAVTVDPRGRDPVCEPSLHACVVPDAVTTPGNPGDGSVRVVLSLDAAVPVTVSGGSAGWQDEPFVLGAWRDSEPVVVGG